MLHIKSDDIFWQGDYKNKVSEQFVGEQFGFMKGIGIKWYNRNFENNFRKLTIIQ